MEYTIESRCRTLIHIVPCLVCILSFGCVEDNTRKLELEEELRVEQDKNRALSKRVESLAADLAKKREQLKALRGLGPDRLKNLFTLKKIELGSHTGGIDTDDKPGHDAIKVILEPIDEDGHVIKAAGAIQIRLLDLSVKDLGKGLIAEQSFPVEKASKRWSGGLFTNHYSFTCPLPKEKSLSRPEITVRVSFTEYLTGNVFTAQKLCTIKPPPGK